MCFCPPRVYHQIKVTDTDTAKEDTRQNKVLINKNKHKQSGAHSEKYQLQCLCTISLIY